MILPWMVVAELKGFHITMLPREYFLDPSKLEEKIDGRTRYVGCSHVMFNTGIRLPVAEIGKICRKNEVLFLADTSQSFGAIRISSEIVKNVDILVGVAYKWLLGPYGSAYGYFSARALKEVRRTHASWAVSANMRSTESLLDYTTDTLPGARKFDRGEAPTYLINAALDGALDTILEKDLGKIEEHNMNLARHFLANLPEGFQTYSTPGTLSPIVCFKSPKEDSAALKARLAKEGIDLTVREGYLRASFHFFNTKAEVGRLLAAL
jgi:selenocysteine lyase/cysteine desulfurase